MKNIKAIGLLFILFATISFGQITVDGDMSDWLSSMQLDVIPNIEEGILDSVDLNWDGIMDSIINKSLDIKDVYVTHDDDSLYIRIDINENGTFSDLESLKKGNMQAAIEIFLDTDLDTATGLTWGWWLTSGDYWINLSVPYGWEGFKTTAKFGINKFIGQNGADSKWEEVAGAEVHIESNLDDNKMEIAIPRTAIGETGKTLESTGIIVLGEDPSAGWVADAVPNNLGSAKNVYLYGRKEIKIDGDMSDWKEEYKFDVEPKFAEGLEDSIDSNWDGVNDGIINPALDIKDIYVTHNDKYLFVRVDINENGTFSDLDALTDAEGYRAPIQLYFDTDLDSATGLTWGYWFTGGDYYVNLTDPDGNPGLKVTQKYGILKFTGANGNDESFEEVMGDSCMVAVNVDDNKIEVAIPRALIGETNGENESTGILVFAEDPTVEWVNDVAPNAVETIRNVYYYGNHVGIDAPINNKIPNSFELSQNYPNPFNPTTTINYAVPKSQKVDISVFNVLGQKVVTLYRGVRNPGNYSVVWNGKNSNGINVPSGVYYYNIHGTESSLTKKMILLK